MALTPIVACVDGSEESMRAAEWAAMEAQRHDTPLRIVSAAALPPRMHAHGTNPPTVADEVVDASARALREAATRSQEVSTGVPIDTDLLTGSPAEAVTDCGSGALMLVVGARAEGRLTGILPGSVSRYAATHAHCPVVVVRGETRAVHREVIAGIRDLGDTSPTLDFAFREAARRDAVLIVVHSPDGLPATAAPADPARRPAEAAQNLAEALRPWRDRYPAVTVREEVASAHPGQVLADYTARADLVVIGRSAGASGAAGGRTRHTVLSHARGPVAVVPSAA